MTHVSDKCFLHVIFIQIAAHLKNNKRIVSFYFKMQSTHAFRDLWESESR